MKIIVYGNGDRDKITGFPTENHFIEYVNGEIFTKFNGRYQYSQNKNADIILLSRQGKAYGYFVISGMENPKPKDSEIAKNPKKVYLVKESISFQNPVRLKDLGVTHYQFGKTISDNQFEKIKKLGGPETIRRV